MQVGWRLSFDHEQCKGKEIEMSEKKRMNRDTSRTVRVIGSLAFKILVAAMCLLLLGAPLWASPSVFPHETDLAQQNTTVRIEPSQLTVMVSETFTASLMIDNVGAPRAFELELLGIPNIVTMDGLPISHFALSEGENPSHLQDLRLVDTFENSRVASDENGSVIYVKADATGASNGTSWADARTNLQTALTAARASDEIWVVVGTYKPTTSTDRTATFRLKNGVALYGGFAGGETSRDQRDWETNVTILSGDIGIVGGNSDNSYHVVTGSYIGTAAVLDGFTVTGGNANGDWTLRHDRGGGMSNRYYSNPTLTNCTFSGNSARNGGGMYNYRSNPTLTNCTFSGNSASNFGGGMHNFWNSNPTLTNCTFSGNSARYGGGMNNDPYSSPTVTNCTFSSNSARSGGGMSNNYRSHPVLVNCTFSGNSGGGMRNSGSSNPTLRNTILANSSSGRDCYGPLTSEGYNLDSDGTCGFAAESDFSNTDPLLGPLQDNGGPTLTHALLVRSPAIDAGNPAGCTDPWGNPLTTDQRGKVRPADGDYDGIPICDIGSYEAFDSD